MASTSFPGRFRLLHYFSIISAIVIVLTTVAVFQIYHWHQTVTLLRTAEDQNVALARAFANTIWSHHGNHLVSVDDLDGETLRAHRSTTEIDQELQRITRGLPVLKIKIFNLQGNTIYSSDFSQIGENKMTNEGFLRSLRQIVPASKITYRGSFSAFSGIVANVHLAETYVPITDMMGRIESVFELYTDVTSDVMHLQENSWSAAILAVLASSGFYLVLLLVVRRADRIICGQHQDLTAFNAKLETAKTRLDAALEHMSHGLAMFDHQGRLLVCNEKYPEIYGLPRGAITPGMDFQTILKLGGEAGGMLSEHVRRSVEQQIEMAAAPQPSDRVIELNGNQYVAVAHRPLPIGGWVSTHEDITHRKRAEAQIAHMALHDAMTGLPNRIMHQQEMRRALDRWRRHGNKAALLYLDLDGFKCVNDTHGHLIGDELLKQVAMRLRSCVGDEGMVARLGGDEFSVIQFNAEKPGRASALATRIIEALCEAYTLSDRQVTIGASLGIALIPADGDEADLLLRHADLALYRSKVNGKGRFCFFEAAMDLAVDERRKLEVELRQAYRDGEFELHYQPILHIETQAVTAFEALIRWNHPRRGLLLPGDFMAAIEDIGIINLISEWVIRQACETAANWPKNVRVTVNLSSRQFSKDTTLVQTVVSALASSGLAPQQLELEVTENVLLAEKEDGLSMLRQLRDLGVSISLDDFGTGYASLSHLRRFPFDKIKIDRSLVHEMVINQDSLAVVRAVCELTISLGMMTVGEGVETMEQWNCLKAMGCREVQGYLVSAPKPGCDIGQLLLECGRTLGRAA